MKKYYIASCLISCLFLLNGSATAKQALFSINDIIHKIPFKRLIENDVITSEQIEIMLKNDINTVNKTNWRLKKKNNNTIIFQNEHEKWVLRSYPLKEKKHLLLINTQLGNHGQSQNFTFFIFENKTGELSKAIEKSYYIDNVKDNDFLSAKNKI